MRSSMKKTTLREIKNSFGRWFAILAIVALGVGFFAGLMMTTPSMLQTGSDYINEKELYDLRLLSTLGFEKDAVKLFEGNEDLEAVEGAVSSDFLAQTEDGESFVLMAQTLLDVQNQVVLVDGRMPEAPDECLADASAVGLAPGRTLHISEENEDARRDLFAYDDYEIVGTVNAVNYVQYERGSSSLGNGRITGYVYLQPEGFEDDYYTEIFLRQKQDYTLYSDEYKASVDALKDWAEPLTEQAAAQRYDSIMAEAEEKIADAEAELEEKTAEAREELADAQKKIADGEAELADAQEKIADGEKELADAKAELADGEKELEENARELADARAQIEDGLEQISQGKAQIEAAIAAGQAAMQQGALSQASGADPSQAGVGTLQAGAGALQADAGMSQVGAGALQVGAGMTPTGMDPAQAAMLASQLQQLSAQLSQLEAQETELRARLAQVEAGEAQVRDGRKELEEARGEIADGEAELEENRKKLEDAQADLEEGQQEYADGERELEEKTAEAQEEIDDARAELADIEEPDTYVLGRDTNLGYACFENDSSIVAGIARVFPIFFFLVAALVCITTMNRMVEEQRTQIGVLKALGYSEGKIMGKYLFYSGSAAVIGAVAGFFAGAFIFPVVIWEAYKIMYRMGEIRIRYSIPLALISLAVALLCSMGTTWLTCRYELNSVAAELIRPRAPKNGKRILLERATFLWGRLSFLVKVSIRNVMRYKRRFFMMVVGIGGCTALLVTGFGIKDSIADVASQQYEEILNYDMSLTLKDPIPEEGGADFSEAAESADVGAAEGSDGAAGDSGEAAGTSGRAADGLAGVLETAARNGMEAYTAVSEKALDLTGPAATKAVNVVIAKNPEEIGSFINLCTDEMEPIAWPGPGELVLNREVADKCGIRVGDTVSLRNDDGERLEGTVVALCRNFVYNYAYICPETWEEDNGELPEYKSLYLTAGEDTDLRALSEALLECEEVSAVSVNRDFMDRVNNMMGSLDYIVLLIILCAGALAFIVIYNLTNINITERIREIATIKVLGFYPGETASYVFRENVVLTAIGALVGQGLGVWLHRFVMSQIRVDMVSFDVRVLPASFCKSIVLTFVFMAVVDVFMYLKLERIDMAESLKSIE